MKPARLNFLSAVVSIIGSLILLATARVPSAFVWFAASIVWLGLAVRNLGELSKAESAGWRMVRRFSRLLLFS
jgi:hypothetical protein